MSRGDVCIFSVISEKTSLHGGSDMDGIRYPPGIQRKLHRSVLRQITRSVSSTSKVQSQGSRKLSVQKPVVVNDPFLQLWRFPSLASRPSTTYYLPTFSLEKIENW